MKKPAILLLTAMLLLCGCSKTEDLHPEWAGLVRADDLMAVNTPAGFTLSESNDVLSLNGIYYFAWSKGEGREITNEDEKTATVYDCQVYLLAAQCEDSAQAEASIADWKTVEAESYAVTELESSGSFDRRTLVPQKETTPFRSGAAAFAATDKLALSLEVYCADGSAEDPAEVLDLFLKEIRLG